MQNNLWEWINSKSLNKIIVAGVSAVLLVAFRTEILDFLDFQLHGSDEMESSSDSSDHQEPTTSSSMSSCSERGNTGLATALISVRSTEKEIPLERKSAKEKSKASEENQETEVKAIEMPPRRKRKASQGETKAKRSKEDSKISKNMISSAGDDELSKPFSLRKCRSWFLQYAAQDDPETIGPDGIEKLCHDLRVDPENVVMLVIAWKLQAETLGFFKFTEWSKGMGNLECDSTAKLQARLGSLSTILRDNPTFKKVYRYAFDFCRNRDQRTLDIDTGMAMLKVLLRNRWDLLDSFLEFLQQSKKKVFNRDQWCNVLEFSRSISSDLSNYDEDGAWPVLMDEFVEWYRTTHDLNTNTCNISTT